MTKTIDHEIHFNIEKQSELELDLAKVKQKLVDLKALSILSLKYTDLVSINEFECGQPASTENDGPIEMYINTYPGDEDIKAKIINGNFHWTAKGAKDAAGFGNITTLKLVEAAPEEEKPEEGKAEEGMVWANVYSNSTSSYPVHGYWHETRASANSSAGADCLGTVLIKRPESC